MSEFDVKANRRYWDRLRFVPDSAAKPFRRGGFGGTDINPQWRIQAMTEAFGPCGIGWGIGEPKFQVIPVEGSPEVLVYCWVAVWVDDGQQCRETWGVGGDKCVTHWASKGRTDVDDEAFKKAFTDAFGNAMRQYGVAADIYLGKWEDSKYQAERHAALEERAFEEDPVVGKAKELIQRFKQVEKQDEFDMVIEDVTGPFWKQLNDKSPSAAKQLKIAKDAAEQRIATKQKEAAE